MDTGVWVEVSTICKSEDRRQGEGERNEAVMGKIQGVEGAGKHSGVVGQCLDLSVVTLGRVLLQSCSPAQV